ncbi:hypothetical protein DRW41_09880 [Neobacillus piezotolerans]|uniref:Uncharacterized protein n=1 Tax=Neobacillus piezotolerans TaxID=2259171 RepID=A0A3D8GR82_9BACI|nr:hypothetical protein [Neobacillus piezotolerans]RDU36994.1 hypothetical protein DRW41_09880 [Neobacillus piezotolerans]
MLMLPLAGCSEKEEKQPSVAVNNNQSENTSEEGVLSGLPDSVQLDSYSSFNKLKLDDFILVTNRVYDRVYEEMGPKENLPRVMIGNYETMGEMFTIQIVEGLDFTGMLNEDGTVTMVTLVKQHFAEDVTDKDELAKKKEVYGQFEILKKTLIGATAPQATADDIKAIEEGLAQVQGKTDEPTFSYKGITYTEATDISDPENEQVYFFITPEAEE